jgi:acyl-CoA synthetase (AMP-forming)/AMP-acid ligase II
MNFTRYLLEEQRDPEKLFILGDHGTLTYAEFAGRLENLASVLFKRYGSGNNILVMADNTPFFIIAYLSIIYSGNSAILVETRIGKTDLAEITTASSPSGALVQEKYAPYFEGAPYDIMNETVLQEPGDGSFFHSPPRVQDDDVAVIIFTSGSTGKKKGVMLTHKNLIANTGSIIAYLGLDASDRMCVALPFFYCYGASLLHTHLRAGGSIVLNQ